MSLLKCAATERRTQSRNCDCARRCTLTDFVTARTYRFVSQIESCYATEQTYTNCTFSGNSLNGQSTGLKIGAAAGSVTASLATDGFTVLATSSSSDVFTITKSAATGGSNQRTCTPASTGGCPASGSW